ncbi:MAG: hypothetical protein HN348_11175, partial [Proteobacteria bacterium]|nr:hypothetical protein [Pseudomonadota bacterium]
FDGIAEGDAVDSGSKTIENTPPTISGCTVGPSLPRTGDDILASTSGWLDPDGDGEQYNYRWYRNNSLDSSVTTSTYPSSKTQRDYDIRVECIPTDGIDTGPAQPSGTVTVINTTPTQPQVHIEPQPNPLSTQQLEAVTDVAATDADGDPINYLYYWTVDTYGYPNPSYPSQNKFIATGVTTEDEFWLVNVVAYDGIEEGPAGTASVQIINSPPSLSLVALSPTTPNTSDNIVSVPMGWSDPDNDDENYLINWYRNGIPDGAEVTDTYPSSKTQRGDMLKARYTPDDGKVGGVGSWVESAEIEVLNAKPTAPQISVNPFPPDEDDNLTCTMDQLSTDADGDGITYKYNWYSTLGDSILDSQTVSWTHTEMGEGWYCTAMPNDGVDDGYLGTSNTVYIQDQDAPAPPVIDNIYGYRNETSVTLTGSCEANCEIDFYCSDDNDSWEEEDDCSGGGVFSHAVLLDTGETTSCYATCTDLGDNTSGNSNTVSTQTCSVTDTYEGAGYGDSSGNPVDEWATMPDNGSQTVTVSANILEGDAGDWYLMSTSDNVNADISAGIDYYDFQVEVSGGSSLYTVLVYYNGSTPGHTECSNMWDVGYTDYNDYVYDRLDGSHGAPNDRRYCSSGSSWRNNCNNMGATYYIEVLRDPEAPWSCEDYELTISNGS